MAKHTAFHEALLSSEEDDSLSRIPSYMVNGDTLNLANRNRTFLESATDNIQSIERFIGVSMISGANQLYNIPASIGNAFGGDNVLSDTAEVIAELDSDLGLFYEDHRDSADLVGFMISSVVPGIGGIKILNAGQKALSVAIKGQTFGSSMAKSFGLLPGLRAANKAKAIASVANNSSAATLGNANALKAIAAGFGQNALEALAFESAVSATLFDSPMLENQDFGNFAVNVMLGAGVFGIVGSAVDAAVIKSALTKTADAASKEARPWTFIKEHAKASSTYESIALDVSALHAIPPIPTGLNPDRINFLKSAAESTARTLNNRIRSNLLILAKEDNTTSETIFNLTRGLTREEQLNTYIGLTDMSRMGQRTKEVAMLESMEKKIASGMYDFDDPVLLAEMKKNLNISYTRTWGDDAGTVYTESPAITQLIDTIGKDDIIKVTDFAVTAGDTQYKFSTRFITGKRAGLDEGVEHYDVLENTVLTNNARYIWASELPHFNTLVKGKIIEVSANDIPILEKLYRDIPDSLRDPRVKIVNQDPSQPIAEGIGIRKFIENQKIFLANRAHDDSLLSINPLNQEQIAANMNVRVSMLSGEVGKDMTNFVPDSDLFAMQSYTDDYAQLLIANGMRESKALDIKIWNVPQHIRSVYDTTTLVERGTNNAVIENMVIIAEQQNVYQAGLNNASLFALGPSVYGALETITSETVRLGAAPSGAGASALAAASSNYGTLAASTENIGNIATRAIGDAKKSARDALEPVFYKLSQNQQAAIEWSNLNATLRSIPGEYALDDTGQFLEPIIAQRWRADVERFGAENVSDLSDLLPPDMPMKISLVTQEVKDAAVVHIAVNGNRTDRLVTLRAAQGVQMNRSSAAFYPVPINPQEFKHFAIVIDNSITSGNQSKTLFANTEEELKAMAAKLKENSHLTVLFKKEAEDYYSSIGQWDYEKTLNSNYLDTEAQRKGISAPFIISTDPAKITSDSLAWHLQRETGLVREGISAKYEIPFNELRRLGDEYTAAATSTFSDQSLLTYAEEQVKNPFADYIKTALGVKKNESYPWFVELNRVADRAVSSVLRRASAAVRATKTPDELFAVNAMLEKAGYKGAAYDIDMEIFANAPVNEGALSAIVQKANSLLATIVLRLDMINAVNNAVSANVLLGAETKAVIGAIGRGDEEAVGALAALTRIAVPGTGETIFSPTKLIANSIKKFGVKETRDPLMKFYKDNGFVTSITDQYKDNLDQLTFRGAQDVKGWDSRVDGMQKKLGAFGDAGERLTGNRLAEEFNRFVAADVMKQMTDVAVARNLMTAQEQLAYINTFVNRTQGNYLASQRPGVFQGPLGQAMGLFQTYQFNLMQQLLRHVGEGHAKDGMVLLGLQGTIHGMNGLPAFNAVNTHLIGEASGNVKHRDAYDSTYGIVGKEAGDWLMYGAASNALGLLHPDLKINLYTRGDINPRHVTILPTNPSTVPIVQATGKFFANMFDTARKLAAGGDVVTTLLQGLEHNGISRPLAGLAATLEGVNNPRRASYTTSSRGNVIASNDLLSLANLSRIAGAKPMDEAIAIDAAYRYRSYGLVDSRRRNLLGKAIKSTMIAGANPTQQQIEGFAEKYAAAGGRVEEFNSWFTQLYKSANVSQANTIQRSLSSPFTQAMQTIMGGRELRDFTNYDEQ